MFVQMLKDKEPHLIATKFINTLVQIALRVSSRYSTPVVLSGGVFQNRTLMEQILQNVTQNFHFPIQLAINDGGICVGQLYKVLEK